jgi:RNA polymerase sigma-70 factor (ECF subfamily)
LEEFPELVEQHQAMVFRTLARLTGEREGLEDLAQDVFLRLFRALPHFRGQAKVSTFLYRIIVNVVNDEWSRRQAARCMDPIDDEAQVLVNPGPDPGELLERGRLQEALDASLEQLKLRDRTILTLHYQEGRSYEEIAKILDLPMGTVKTNLYRARERLKDTMKEWIQQCKVKC